MEEKRIIDKDKMLRDIEKMNAMGPRLTGNKAHKEFIDYLKNEIHEMGIDVFSDLYFFDRWEEKSKSLEIHEIGENVSVPISSSFPYSGQTDDSGVTGELVYIKDKHLGYLAAKNNIAVIEIGEVDFLSSAAAFDRRKSEPEGLELPEKYKGPVATAFVNFPFLNMAKFAGVKAVICIWKGIHVDCIEGQYLPFILDYQGIPAVWVNEKNGEKVIQDALLHKHATLKLEADIERHSKTETFYCMLEGENKSEAVIVNSHTDGTNCVEENGPVAMLEMIRNLKDKNLKRTHIFVFVTGHFRLPDFKNILGGGVQATSKFLAAHPDFWDGKRGHIKAVAALSVEHLGVKQWTEQDGEYKMTGDVETELCYTGNEVMDDIYYKSLENRSKVRTITLRGHNFLHFGEGQPLFNVGIPEIALVTAPDSLCVISQSNEMEKFDIDLMHEQTVSFMKMIELIEVMPTTAIGGCDNYSLPLGTRVIRKLKRKLGNDK